jgi:hypothetical protein
MKRLLMHNRMTTGLIVLCGLLTLIVLAEFTLLDTTDFEPDTSDDKAELPADTNSRFIPKSLAYFTVV